MSRRRPIRVVPILLLVAIAGLVMVRLQPRVSDDETPVSLASLQRHVAMIAAEPHPVGSAANARVRDYLLGELRALGLEPWVEPAEVPDRLGRPVTLENILCIIPAEGSNAVGRLTLACHYDSRPGASGAGDDAAAVAGMLETARLLVEQPPAAREVLLLITDGEEAGMLGAKAFMAAHPEALGTDVVLNFEARGTKGPSVMFQSSGLSPSLLNHYATASPQPVTSSLADEVYRRLPNNTDFTIFARGDLRGLNFAFFDGFANYHTPRDDPAHLSNAALLHQGAQLYALARSLSDAPHLDDALRAMIYFDVLSLVVVRYPQTWAWPLTALATLAAAGALWALRPRPVLLVRALARHGVHFMAVVAWIHLLTRLPMEQSTHQWTPLAFFGAAVLPAVGLPWLYPSGGRGRRAGIAGVLLILAVLTLLLTLLLPAGSYLLTWPTLFTGLAGCIRSPKARPVALVAAAVLSTLVLLPIAWLVTVALTMKLLAVGAVVLTILWWIWRPVLSGPSLRSGLGVRRPLQDAGAEQGTYETPAQHPAERR